jgi:hypothetical protein
MGALNAVRNSFIGSAIMKGTGPILAGLTDWKKRPILPLEFAFGRKNSHSQ